MSSGRVLFGAALLAGGIALLIRARRATPAREPRRTDEQAPPPPPAPTSTSSTSYEPSVFATDVDEVGALARVITSEAADGSEAERRAIGWAIRNRARSRGVSILELVCTPHCGPQWERGGKLRPASSARRAAPRDVVLAREILSMPQEADPTGGATGFIEPAEQDRLNRMWRRGERLRDGRPVPKTRPYAEVRAAWIAGGDEPLGVIGRFEFWRRRPRRARNLMTAWEEPWTR